MTWVRWEIKMIWVRGEIMMIWVRGEIRMIWVRRGIWVQKAGKGEDKLRGAERVEIQGGGRAQWNGAGTNE